MGVETAILGAIALGGSLLTAKGAPDIDVPKEEEPVPSLVDPNQSEAITEARRRKIAQDAKTTRDDFRIDLVTPPSTTRSGIIT